MSPGYQFTADLLEDLLFRAGEPTDGSSDFAAAGLRYLNRSQTAIALGGAEFDASIQEDWWFLRKFPPGVLTLEPIYQTGTVAVVNGSPTITFSAAPPASMATWFFGIAAHPDVFRIQLHTAGATTATLDSPYTGPTAPARRFALMRLEYAVAADVLRVVSPLRMDRAPGMIHVTDVAGLRQAAPTFEWGAWPAPSAGAMVAEQTIRFNGFGSTEPTDFIRVEYDYLARPPLLTNAPNEEPVVPLQWRRLIADGALFFLHMDKNDNRTDGIGLLLIKGLRAMARENHHKQAAQNGLLGQVRPRQDDLGAWGEWDFLVLRP